MSSWFLLIVSFLPIIGGMIVGFIKCPFKVKKIVSYIIVIATSILTWVSLFIVNKDPFVLFTIVKNYNITLKLDSLGKVFAGMVSILWPLALLYSYGYMKHDERKSSYNSFYVMTYGVVLGLAFSGNLLTMFVFYEMLTFITLPLIIHPMTPEAKKAGRFYLYFSLSGSSLSLVGMIMITSKLNTNDFIFNLTTLGTTDIFYTIGYLLCFFGFGVKSAIFPLHYWLPMAGAAPTPTTALLHAVAVVKAGVFALIRITYYNQGLCYVKGTWAQYIVIGIACFTIIYGSCKALKEQHLKRRFAYSTISNLSYIILAMGFMTKFGLIASLVHLVIHSITKICLFFCCGEIIENSEANYVYQLDGFMKKMPITMICFLLAACSITGIPLFAGFVSKFYIIKEGLMLNNAIGYIGVACLVISALLTGMYSLSIPFKAMVNKPNELGIECHEKAHEKNLEMLVPIVIFSLSCVVFGLCSGWFIDLLMSMFN